MKQHNKVEERRANTLWERLRSERAAITIEEFCEILGWHRSRFYRHRHSIKVLEGYGRPMIPTAEVERILEV